MATGTAAVQIVDVVTPAAGESVTEGTVLEWRVKVGDAIKVDETIVEISTDKVDVELPAPATGTVVEILAQEGETVTVGQVIARISLNANGAGVPSAPTAGPPVPSNGAGNGSTTQVPSEATATDAVGTVDVVAPAAGESVSEGTILEWRAKVGEPIKIDETIVEISTDKVDIELPSPATGTVSEILAE